MFTICQEVNFFREKHKANHHIELSFPTRLMNWYAVPAEALSNHDRESPFFTSLRA